MCPPFHNFIGTYIALYEYESDSDKYTSIWPGNIIYDVQPKHDDWWEGEVNGRRGLFPKEYVTYIGVRTSWKGFGR